MKFRNNNLTIGQQAFRMQSLFPKFEYRRKKQALTWVGLIQPTERSLTYRTKVVYPYLSSPRVWIIEPSIVSDAPHRYPDESLCLYYPRDRSWHPKKYIAETIIPWTIEWIALYEIWLATREWYGEEAPHSDNKRKS